MVMPATDSELTSMEDPGALRDVEGVSSDPLILTTTTTRPTFPSETVKQAVSMASNDCSSALSSPAEATPAKPAAAASPTTCGTGPATAHMASDSLTSTGTGLDKISQPPLPETTFGTPPQQDFPTVLSFKGVSVTLENNNVWKQFNSCGTEMILTKPGRRMFPYCRYRLTGLDPERQYTLVISIVPSDPYKYRWSTTKWEVAGPAELQSQGLIRAFSHHYSPCRGEDWMCGMVSFYKLKLTNNFQDQEGHILLQSMHRYIPRLHIIPVPDGVVPTPEQPVVMGPESMTFTFPQTEFMAVTTYQNFRITQLKINHNPFAKGFREDGNNPRLNRIAAESPPVARTEPGQNPAVLKPTEPRENRITTESSPVARTEPTQNPAVVKPAEPSENRTEAAVDLSMKSPPVLAPLPKPAETRLVLKPIMSSPKDVPYVPCIRGKHALGELVLVQNPPLVEPKEEAKAVSVTPELRRGFELMSKERSMFSTFSTSTPGSSPLHRRKRKNMHWSNNRRRAWKAAAAFHAAVIHSPPPPTVAMQPELDDVEGLMFVSFTSKEALDGHPGDKPSSSSPSTSPVSPTTPMEFEEKVEEIPESDEEKIGRLEAILLQDLRLLKHRQVIHPVLQEVGLKLASLDPERPVDLQYLGVRLPLPPPELQDEDTTPAEEGLSFISRTGKTSDMTKIKGWKSKFIRSKETSPHCDAPQKNLSAFCSNMLDEYLESEAQYISERAEAFSAPSGGSVSYQLPVKGSSYVKTLDSVLKNQKAASKPPAGSNRPCPLSHKPLLYSALTSPPPPLEGPAPPPAGAQSAQPGGHRSFVHQPSWWRPTIGFGQNQASSNRASGLTKLQLSLLQMEVGAVKQGLSRTQLTQDRLSVALSVMLTKQMVSRQVKAKQIPKIGPAGPQCGQLFCTLGCVCSSLQTPSRGPLHCRRPDCMFGCTCFKRKITKQLSGGESEEPVQPVYSVTNMEHVVQPRPGSHVNRLWNQNVHDVDTEPLYLPNGALISAAPVKALKRSAIPRQAPPVREEDKDPVYKYLESLMTCARVREFNSKPPEFNMKPRFLNTPPPPLPPTTTTTAPKPTEKPPETSADDLLKMHLRSLLAAGNTKKAENPPQETSSSESGARKQIEIQSVCDWSADRKKVLEVLCQRLKKNSLSQRFYVGPYRIVPISRISMRKPSGSTVTYRVQISKPSKVSDDEEDDCEDSEDEAQANENMEPEEEEGQHEVHDHKVTVTRQIGVTPFLSGVLPAGRLRARTKPMGFQEYGLIQVNGKSYNQARLLLGNMGSLHPANRLAGFVTGRLQTPGGVSLRNSLRPDPALKTPAAAPLHIKAAGSVVPPVITARKTTDLKTPTQIPAELTQHDYWRKGPFILLQPSHTSSSSSSSSSTNTFASVQLGSVQPASIQRSSVQPASVLPGSVQPTSVLPGSVLSASVQSSSVGTFQPGSVQSSSTSSPVSLTVSQSLKMPSFLAQSGTYSFRICPPDVQGGAQQNLSGGVTLPGGFTLIQLPKPGADGAAAESIKTTNTAAVDKAPPQRDALINLGFLGAHSGTNGLGSNPLTGAKDPRSSRTFQDLVSRQRPEETSRQESNTSEDTETDYSDDCGDEDDELVDIETVEYVNQGLAIARMKKAAEMALKESRNGSGKVNAQSDDDYSACKDVRRRKNHTAVERQRRSVQRILFDQLQIVLQSDPRAPRLRLLALAQKEINHLVETSRCLEEKKRRLIQSQAVYVKELSLLSGKPETLIRQKLKEICEKQKVRERTMEWKPFFSSLLQSKAALLQATAPESGLQSRPDFFATPSQTQIAVQNKIMSLLQSHIQSSSAKPAVQTSSSQSAAPLEVATPSLHHQSRSVGQQETPVQVSVPSVQPQSSVSAPPQTTTTQNEAPPTSSTPKTSTAPVRLSKPFTLPLIRSKTGRIILPSSLRQLGQGFYTLTFMEPKKNGEATKIILQPVDTNSPLNQNQNQNQDQDQDQNQDQSSSEPDQKPPDQEPSHPVEEDKPAPKLASLNNTPQSSSNTPQSSNNTPQSSNNTPQSSNNTPQSSNNTPQSSNNTPQSSNNTPQSSNNTPQSSNNTPQSSNNTPQSSSITPQCSSYTPQSSRSTPQSCSTLQYSKPKIVLDKTPLVELARLNKSIYMPSVVLPAVEKLQEGPAVDPDPSPPVVRRGRGRPRKHPITPVTQNTANTVNKPGDTSESETSLAVEDPVPVKRGRGRPPKKKTSPQLWSPLSKSDDYSPAAHFKSSDTQQRDGPAGQGEANNYRPLTRGALGKDFPSAKKRSWIDVEKELELEPDLESE